MIQIAIIGASGRMGQELLALAHEHGFEVSGGVGRSATPGANFKLVDHVSKLDPKKTKLVIDFSLPELTPDVLSWCANEKVPLVSGVTGLTAELKSQLAKAAQSTPILWAPNMSLGVAVLSRMLNELKHLHGFEFQIEELHHSRKKDKPSGTALFLQEKMEAAIGEKAPEPLAIRGGGIFGIHRVWAMGEEETITLEHNAMNRRVFARGAMKAAQWLITQKPALYTINDMLGHEA
ncbi:MAG: 4-hydroxy-tetrahydrodipicolinate reductase [Proteobacteria bacterium]|nr:MAG: 4-hydroxy-tetrahydrodipicolinate reductase [Pseudomonadota bacterium]